MRKLILFVAAVWAALALVFAITDLQVSIAFVNPQSRWANLLEDWGRYPGAIAYISAFCILVFSRFRLFGRKLMVSQQTMVFAKVTLGVTLLNVYLFVPLTKHFWGRVRFCNLDSSFSQYTAWYLPQGPTGHESFASGHAAEGWLLLPIGVVLFSGRSRATQVIITALSIGWGIAVAVSRVRLGAHYASDVLFSSGVGIMAFLLLCQYFSSRVKANGIEKSVQAAPKKDAS